MKDTHRAINNMKRQRKGTREDKRERTSLTYKIVKQ